MCSGQVLSAETPFPRPVPSTLYRGLLVLRFTLSVAVTCSEHAECWVLDSVRFSVRHSRESWLQGFSYLITISCLFPPIFMLFADEKLGLKVVTWFFLGVYFVPSRDVNNVCDL